MNGYWRDAIPSDAIYDPPKFQARFSTCPIVTEDDAIHFDYLYGVVLDSESKEYDLIWESKKSGWQYCQVFVPKER